MLAITKTILLASLTLSASAYLDGTQTGYATYYAIGLGACGITSHDSDYVVAVSTQLFDGYPGYGGSNPPSNPVCGKAITATFEGHSIDVIVRDYCNSCALTDLDFSPTAFQDLSQGKIDGRGLITWKWK